MHRTTETIRPRPETGGQDEARRRFPKAWCAQTSDDTTIPFAKWSPGLRAATRTREHLSDAFGDWVDLARHEAVGLTVDGGRRIRIGSFNEAEDFAVLLVHPVMQIIDVVCALDA